MKNENLKIYLNEIQHYQLLSENQEKNLGYLLLKGTDRQKKNAKRKLVEGNLRLVIYIVNRIHDKGYSSDLDLIQQGNIGLMHATEKFDVRMGVKFSTYAAYWIKCYINTYIAKDILIRHPYDKNYIQPISLNDCPYEDGMDELYNLIEDDKAVNPENEIEKEYLSNLCKEALDSLPLKEKMVLSYRYGFDKGGHSRSLEEVTKLMTPILGKCVSRQYIYQLCQHAEKRIRNNRNLEAQLKEFI